MTDNTQQGNEQDFVVSTVNDFRQQIIDNDKIIKQYEKYLSSSVFINRTCKVCGLIHLKRATFSARYKFSVVST
ncbi:MAG: hypothetical protein AAFV93_07275, partial [Chloroflexota bacterium]